MTTQANRDAAAVLAKARLSGKPCQRISEQFGITNLDDAYAVQEINTQLALEQGRRLTGRKIGLTSLAVQQQLGVDSPDFGMLFADMQFTNDVTIDCKKLIQPKVEGEIAFVLKEDLLRVDTTSAELIQAIDYILPALEIVDSAIENWKITLVDTVADNASSGLYVLGNTPVSLAALDLSLEGMILEKNGEHASIGVGAACLGSPLQSCLWLVRKMAEYGRPLKKGDVVLTGALGPMVKVEAGDHIRLRLTRIGEVGCSFI
ncbi:fumarylacetoacetate hydrolase family protein [Acinetobacter lactucae]|uniref:2-keto-4-pentenoate hydratase n=1 Tax=Acinetobacter lactucae TaxID=1785128 RepID=UPI0021CD8322|nr:fumarylacetoacetate hydrolase family protein [Acinetobacter lactucae]MCU4347720.1 fumarylacetoacetate hydrolase family protein [Acinetobacter lactucae]